jgi:hypothetical protein
VLEIEVEVPPTADPKRIEELVEAVCASAGLSVSLKGTLARYPGCVHWHFKHGRQRGTLEITLWPGHRRLWLTVHENRSAEWVPAAISSIKDELERQLSEIQVRV